VDTFDLFQRLGLALAIGLLIGLERGWRGREQPERTRVAGIRTFALISLLGGLWGAMFPTLGPVPLAAAGFAFAIVFAAFEWRETSKRDDFSVTTTVAGLIAFALGAFAVVGDRAAAAGAGVATMALLAARAKLHELLRKLTWPELRSVVVLLAMTFLLLPVLPDRTVDPWNAINPHELWLLIVLIAAVSFVGYVAVRALGEERGLLVSSAAGAFVSSTAVTLNNARLAAQSRSHQALLSAGILIAWMISLARMSAIALAINPALLAPLLPPILGALGVLGAAALLLHRRTEDPKAPFETLFTNPLDLALVLRFGVLLSLIIMAAKILGTLFGEAGLLALAGFSGFLDVDPITLSSARLAGASITVIAAAQAILLAAAANMTTKIGVTVLVGGLRFGWSMALAGILAVAAGAIILFVMGHP